MNVVCRDKRNTEFFRYFYNFFVYNFLLAEPVILKFEIKIAFSEDFFERFCVFFGRLYVISQNLLGYIPRKACGKRNKPVGMLAYEV